MERWRRRGWPGSLERTILALRAAGCRLGGAARRRSSGTSAGTGRSSDQTNLTAFAVLALRAAGAVPSRATLGWLRRQQDGDGGFNFGTAGGASDVDDTGAVLEALGGPTGWHRSRGPLHRAPPESRRRVSRARPGTSSNAQSTAWAIQGLLAAGADERAAVDRALGYLSSLIAPDGHVRYSRSSDQTPVWVTGEALMALERKPLPLAPVALPGSHTPLASRTPGSRPRKAARTAQARCSRHRRRTAPASPAALRSRATSASPPRSRWRRLDSAERNRTASLASRARCGWESPRRRPKASGE